VDPSQTARPRRLTALVTGATGFLGGFVVEALLRHGVSVRAMVRPTSDTSLLDSLGVERIPGDLDDEVSLHRAVQGADVVVHAAAKVDVIGPWDEHYQTTVDGTRRVANAAAAARVPRFLQVSSASVYHPEALRAPSVTEQQPAGPCPRWAYYSRCKRAAEQIVQRTFAAGPTQWTIARVGYLYGPRNRAMELYYRPVLSSGKVWLIGRGDNPLALCYVEDCAEAIAMLAVAEHTDYRIFNIADDEGITQREVLWALADGFRLPRPTRHIPYSIAMLGGWLGEVLGRATGRPPELNRMMVALMGLPQRLDATALRRATGWQPKTRFADGIRRTFDWYWSTR
jgi:nucleoside-diphosphate-sugar epimerase